MAQDESAEVGHKTDGVGIIITNNVEVSALCGEVTNKKQSLYQNGSVRSHNISISSISDLESESSTPVSMDVCMTEMQRPDITEVFKQQQQQSSLGQNGVTPANIASIAIKDSTDITFGNKTHYHGSVTIKQFLLDREKGKWIEGVDNTAYENGALAGDGGTDLPPHPVESKLGSSDLAYFTKNKYLIVGLVVILVILGTVLISLLAIYAHEDESLANHTSTLRIVTRDEWIAQPPNNPLEKLVLPSLMVIITHTATDFCTTQAECTFRVRIMQTYHIESKNWDDIGYNWLVGGDGQVYEGRGWTNQGAHTKGYNKRSIGIAFIGTFNKVKPEQRQIEAAQMLIAQGVEIGVLDTDYKLYGHRQLIASESPGDELYAIIKTWPHWTAKVIRP